MRAERRQDDKEGDLIYYGLIEERTGLAFVHELHGLHGLVGRLDL